MTTTFDPGLFPDIANAIGLPSPAFVEKDYYAVQLLKVISEIKMPEGKFIFAGGTCLAKVHLPTFRMSEDIDIKFLPTEHFLNQSDTQKRKNRSILGNSIFQKIEQFNQFSVVNKESRSEGRYRCFSVNYPKTYNHTSLRPELKLEFTEIALEYLPAIEASISSIYSNVTKQAHEILALKCDNVNLILIEKFVGLLRRIAEASRGYSDNEDEALIRHVYDLHLINMNKKDFVGISELFAKIVKRDIAQFVMRHKEFKEHPLKELTYGLQLLSNEKKHRERYHSFLGPLVYNANPPSWEQGLESLNSLAKILINS